MTAFPTLNAFGTRRLRGFSVTELLVVIAIIAVLVTLLLVALGGVTEKARSTRTVATMSEFAKACDTFQLEHGRYPGGVPDTALAATPPLSMTELMLLDLMGDYRTFHPTLAPDPSGAYANGGGQQINLANGWQIKIDLDGIGDGPELNGQVYAPYFTPRPEEFKTVRGQFGGASIQSLLMPDLVDAWGQPIVALRQGRRTGNLVGSAGSNAQFVTAGMVPYTRSTQLGELGQDQLQNSILNDTTIDPNRTLAQLIRNPAFGARDMPLAGTPRGAVVLFSAGADGIYFSKTDGPGSSGNPIVDIVDGPNNGPQVVDEYDDVMYFTGGS